MAEALGAVGALLAVAQIIQSSLELARKYSKAITGDERFETLYWNIRTEKKTTDGWIANMRLHPGGIPPNETQEIEAISERLKATYSKVEERLMKYRPSTAGKMKASPLARVHWLSGGYEDLVNLVDLLRALNTALRTIAPPLPGYHGDVSYEARPLRPSDLVTPHQDPVVPDSHIEDHSEPKDKTVRLLHTTCVTGISQMIKSNPSSRVKLGNIEDRLSLWSNGLNDNSLSIDILLASSNTHTKDLRTFLLSSFVEIAFTQEQLLSRWIEDEGRADRARLESCRNRLTTVLAEEELSSLTLRKWQVTLAENANRAVIDDNEDLEYIDEIVQALFDILPAIRGVRQELVLRREAQEAAIGSQEQDSLSQPNTAQGSTERLIMDNLEKVRMIEDATRLRSQSRAGGDAVTLYSGAFAKTTRRLEEWKVNASDNEAIAARARTQDVERMQRKLASELDRFFDSNGKVRDFSSTTSSSLVSEKPSLLRGSESLAPQDLENLVKTCDFAIRHLYTATEV